MAMHESGDPHFFWPGNVHRINFVADRYLVFASPGAGTAHVFDLETLEALVTSARPGDTIVFAFAGHGVADRDGQLRLASQDATIDTLAASSVGWDEIAAILSRAPTRVVVLLDACHAGNANFDRLTKNDAVVKALLAGVRSPVLIFAASKGRELSRERDGSGVFTRAFVNALSGQSPADQNSDGLLDVSELYSAVKRDVVAATGGQQTPWLARGDLLGDFPLFERLTNFNQTGLSTRAAIPRSATLDSKPLSVDAADAKNFVSGYWRTWSDPGIEPAQFVASVFADQVLFYGQTKSRNDILQDPSNYIRRWPYRNFALQERTLKTSCEQARRTCRVEGVLDFEVHNDNPGRSASGVAKFILQLKPRENSFRITLEDGNVLKRGEGQH